MADWAWIPLTLWAAFAQTLRNAAQRSLIQEVGTLGATLVRFLYGLPFSIIWLLGVLLVAGQGMPGPNRDFVAWVTLGGVSQIAATALLLRVMTERNFALGVAYSKTEIVLVAVFGLVFQCRHLVAQEHQSEHRHQHDLCRPRDGGTSPHLLASGRCAAAWHRKGLDYKSGCSGPALRCLLRSGGRELSRRGSGSG